jgi:hypothetical protein
MPQNVNFPFRHEASGQAAYVELEPGDATLYRFVMFPSAYGHNWGPQDRPVVAVASLDGPLFPGIWLSVPRAKEWWYDTKDHSAEESLSHTQVAWVLEDSSRRLGKGRQVNPWTARAAMLAVLIKVGEIRPEEGGEGGGT